MTEEQIDCLIDDITANTEIPAGAISRGYLKMAIMRLHSQTRLLADGCVGVPEVPTADMMQAGSQVWKDASQGSWGHAACVYTAMIAAQTEKRDGE